MFRLIVSIVATLIGIYIFSKRLKQYKVIDSESTATVIRVINLGAMGTSKSYGIEYEVSCDIPFRFFETPVTKPRVVNEKRTIKYQEQNPKNYYFPSKIFKSDKRLFPSLFLTIIGALSTISSILLLIL